MKMALLGSSFLALLSFAAVLRGAAGLQSSCQALDPSPPLEPFVDALPIIPSINVSAGRWVNIGAYRITQKLHRDLPPTALYAYGTTRAKASYPGPTLHATKHVRTRIQWSNHIRDRHHLLTIDRSIHWAAPAKGGVPLVPHLHGSETDSRFDGHPEAWWTAGGETGPAFHTRNYRYPNEQRATNLWYHDHALGLTRLNVLAGLAGFYLLRDAPGEEPLPGLPQGTFDIPVLFQDKTFWSNGSINFPSIGNAPDVHPSWCPEYFGDVMVANGKVWPFLDVLPVRYRFRLLNAANARFLQLFFSDPRVVFFQIGTDGGYLHRPRNVSLLTLAPGERADVVVDFSLLPPGTVLYLNNSAPAPFPSGDPSFSPAGTTFIIKFTVVHPPPSQSSVEDSSSTNYYVPQEVDTADDLDIDPAVAVLTRKLLMQEFDDPVTGVPIYSLLGGKRWREPVTETPRFGTTEVWEIVNLTEDAHPIHLHLVRFKVHNRQPFNADAYSAGTCDLASDFPSNTSCYTGPAQAPRGHQLGWKDTAVTYPEEVTRFVIRFTSQDGHQFGFDPFRKPGYVWHCHILDHEDNEMMRPLRLRK